MASIRRLRWPEDAPGFRVQLEHHKCTPGTWGGRRLAEAIGRLRRAETLPLERDARVDLWGGITYWAHLFSSKLWLYYKFDDEALYLITVHDHLSEM